MKPVSEWTDAELMTATQRDVLARFIASEVLRLRAEIEDLSDHMAHMVDKCGQQIARNERAEADLAAARAESDDWQQKFVQACDFIDGQALVVAAALALNPAVLDTLPDAFWETVDAYRAAQQGLHNPDA